MPRGALIHGRRRAAAIALLALAPVSAGAVALSTCDCWQHEHGAHTVAGAAVVHAMPMGWVVQDEPTATRLANVITTREATAQLSGRCRRLIKVQRRSSLTKGERRQRLACVRERREIVQRSIAEATGKTPALQVPDGAAPTPTPAPGASPLPAGATPTPAPTAAPAPKGACASVPNAVYAAVGVDAYDGGGRLYFQLTRGTVTADCVSFELRNHDAQAHNLYIQEKGKDSTFKPIVQSLDPGPGGTVTRANAELRLAPGTYTLRCLLPGHDAMTVDFTVIAPAR